MKTTTRRSALAALAIILVTVTAGCFPQGPNPAPPCTPPALGTDAYEFGDSLSSWAAHTLTDPDGNPHFTGICENFTEAGVGLSLNAFGGTRVDHHWPTFEGITPGVCVLVFLGTNDLTNLTLEEAKWNALAGLNLLHDAGASRVVWALLDENSASHRPAPALAETRGYNAFLRQLVADQTYGGLLVLFDWNARAAGHDEYLLGATKNPADWVHHTDTGAGAYATAVRDAYHEGCPA